MDKQQKALDYFSEGFNCAQAVFSAYAEDFGMDREEALKIATSFGGGMAQMGETCGAVTGAFMVLGLKYGKVNADDNEAKEKTYRKVLEVAGEFKKRNRFLDCRELLKQQEDASSENIFKANPASCPKLVSDAIEILGELLRD